MTETLGHMGPMYRRRGLDTDQNLISSRITAARAAYEELSQEDLAAVVRTGLGVPKSGDLEGLVDEVRKVDVTFDPSASQPEMVLMATAILRQAIDDGDDFGEYAALAATVAAFGGLRTFEADVELGKHAQQTLTRCQDIGLPEVSSIKYSKRPPLEQSKTELETFAAQNDLSQAHASLKKILDSAPAYTESAYKALVQQCNSLASAHNRLSENMNAHWWVLNGWSLDAERAFADLSMLDAVLRMGVELARLTKHSTIGLFAAPALLARALKHAGFDPAHRARLGDVASASPIDWRKKWAPSEFCSAAIAPLLPLTLAVAFAVEADDASDWEPRYERASGVSSDALVDLLSLAHQVYLESLLRTHVSA